MTHRLHGKAAVRALLLHAALLLLACLLGGAMGGLPVQNLPQAISVNLEPWPAEKKSKEPNQIMSKKAALLPEIASGKNKVSAAVGTRKKISEKNLSQEKAELAEKENCLAHPAASEGSLPSQAASGHGSGTGTEQTTPFEVMARPLSAINPPPSYPRLARRLGMQGVVLLEVFVSASGMVETVKVATGSGHEILDQAALKTIRDWQFAAGLHNGRPAAMWIKVPVRFKLRD